MNAPAITICAPQLSSSVTNNDKIRNIRQLQFILVHAILIHYYGVFGRVFAMRSIKTRNKIICLVRGADYNRIITNGTAVAGLYNNCQRIFSG